VPDAAITSAKSAFGPVKDAAEKYVPDETAAVESSINAAQTAYNNGDYGSQLWLERPRNEVFPFCPTR